MLPLKNITTLAFSLFFPLTLIMIEGTSVSSAYSAEGPPPHINIAFDNYPPYHYWVDGVPTGLHIDLIDEIFSRIEASHSYVRRPWKRSLQDIKNGEITALCAGMKNSAREKYAYYPSRHLSLETNWVISLARKNMDISSLQDLKGLSIGTIAGYSYGVAFDSFPNLNKFERGNEQDLIEMLVNERVDVIVGSDLVIRHVAKILGVEHFLKFDIKLTSDPLYLIMSKAVSSNEQMLELVSKAMSQMTSDGTYQKILRRYSGMPEIPTYSVTTEYWPPFRMLGSNGEIEGIDIEIMEEIGKRLGVKFVWHRRPWARCLAELEDGLADIITGLAHTKERSKFAAYTSRPYYEMGPAFYLNDHALAQSIKKYENLYGISIGYSRGSVYFKRFDSDKKLNKKAGTNERQLIDMVLAKRWDAFVGTDAQIEYDLGRLGLENKLFKATFVPQDRIPLYLGISRKSKFVEEISAVNAIMNQLIEDGTVRKIISKYLK
jgi:polar amino acid transport system substrate-binding protein